MTYHSEKRKTVGLQKLKTVKKGSGRYAKIIRKAGLTENDLISTEPLNDLIHTEPLNDSEPSMVKNIKKIKK